MLRKLFLVHFSLFVAVASAVAQDLSSWMSRLDDATFVSLVSIPGTHDSATGHGFTGFLGLFGGESYARTQDKTLTEQWNGGIRAFDLRPCVDGSALRINHGVINTNLTLDKALQTLCGLLDEHPTEMAIVIMRHETEGDDNSSQWAGMVKALVESEPVKSHAVNFTPTLKMANVRGKLLIISRDEYASTPTGAYITGWGFSADFDSQKNGRIKRGSASATCYIQDFYDVSASGASATKTAAVLNLLRFTAEQNTSSRIWAINHTSGYSKTGSLGGSAVSTSDGYRDNAATQNAAVINFLADHSGPTGLVMMDYAATDRSNGYDVRGLALAKAIIENNFRESDYAKAMAAITAGATYRIFTEHAGSKCFLTADGHLTAELSEAGQFTFRKVKGEEYGNGFKLMKGCFTNPDLSDGEVILTPGCIRPNTQTTPRDTWEAQVFLLNDEGRYAIRATNAAGGDSGWALAAKTFWTVVEDTTAPLGIVPAYTFDRHYIWQIEVPDPVVDAITLTPVLTPAGKGAAYRYNLSGQRFPSTQPPSRGLHIINGRKVLIR